MKPIMHYKIWTDECYQDWSSHEYTYTIFCEVQEEGKLTHEFQVERNPKMRTTEKDFICTCKHCFETILYLSELDKFHTFLFNLCMNVA